jgi:hypothetical protein
MIKDYVYFHFVSIETHYSNQLDKKQCYTTCHISLVLFSTQDFSIIEIVYTLQFLQLNINRYKNSHSYK